MTKTTVDDFKGPMLTGGTYDFELNGPENKLRLRVGDSEKTQEFDASQMAEFRKAVNDVWEEPVDILVEELDENGEYLRTALDFVS